MGLDEVLDLRLRRFWFLVNTADRLKAEEDIRLLQIFGSAQSEKGFEEAQKALRAEMGQQVFVWEEKTRDEMRIVPDNGLDPEFDRKGLQALKAMAG